MSYQKVKEQGYDRTTYIQYKQLKTFNYFVWSNYDMVIYLNNQTMMCELKINLEAYEKWNENV